MKSLLCNKYFQTQLQTLSAAPVSDGEILVILQEYFSLMGTVNSVHRFAAAERSDKRCYMINFANSADANKVAQRYKLRPYAFTGVLVELAHQHTSASICRSSTAQSGTITPPAT